MPHMTHKGEPMTPEGEITAPPGTALAFNKSLGMSCSMDAGNPGQLVIRLSAAAPANEPIYQMIFVLKGRVDVLDANFPESSCCLTSGQHNLCRFDPGNSRLVMSDAADEVICINLSQSFISQYLPRRHVLWERVSGGDHRAAGNGLFGSNLPITPVMAALVLGLGKSGTGSFSEQLLFESRVIELLALQVEQLESQGTQGTLRGEEMKRMQLARQILLEQGDERLSLRELAHRAGTNEYTLKRDFKAAFGTTVYGYLNQYRMEQAKTILVEKDITIAELAAKMGYKHATHFSSAFKKYFGYLPNVLKGAKLVSIAVLQQAAGLAEQLILLAE
jgi:AraC-like DNA-binding protein